MADYRYILTKIWSDPYYQSLKTYQKLIFIYLFTNPHTTQPGIYPITEKTIVFETGIQRKFVAETLSKFQKDGKIKYQNNILWVINFLRYQPNASPTVMKRIAKDLKSLQNNPFIEEFLDYYDTLSIPYQYPTDSPPYKKEKEKDTKRKEKEQFLSNKTFIALKKYLDFVNQGRDMTLLAINTFKKYGENEVKKALGRVEKDYSPRIERFWEALKGDK